MCRKPNFANAVLVLPSWIGDFYWTDGYWQGFGPFGPLSHFLGHAAAVTAWGQCAPAGQRTLPLHILYIYTYMYAYMYAVVV